MWGWIRLKWATTYSTRKDRHKIADKIAFFMIKGKIRVKVKVKFILEQVTKAQRG